jgi:small conductance mechanosensitive channel
MKAVLCTLLAFFSLVGTGGAQVLNAGATPAPSNGIRQQGQYLTAPITLDGARLFTIASPVVPAPGSVPIAQRQAAVENALAQVILVVRSGSTQHTLYSASGTKVHLTPSNGQVVLDVSDAAHPSPLTIVTVTPIDAKYNGTTMTSLANQWQPVLQDAIHNALLVRQPGVERKNRTRVGIAAGILVGITLLAWLLIFAPLRREIRWLEDRADERDDRLQHEQQSGEADHTESHTRRRHFLALALRAMDPRREAAALRAVCALVIWLVLVLWFAAFVWGFLLFPQTTPLAREALHTTAIVLGIWIGFGVLNRLLDLLVARLGAVWRMRHYRSSEERARELLRIPTITSAITGFKTFLLIFIGLLLTLSQVGIPVWSVVTFGGLTAIGLTLAAQNFVRDFFNGFLVLFEDQYVVGDYITINSQSGIVEELTLRMAQLRDTAGNLITIPHSTVTTVINHTRNWSRVDYRVSVDPGTDVQKAIDIVRDAVHDVAMQEAWKGAVLEPVEWIGVDALSRDGVTIRTSIKTAPLRQFELRRAINEHVSERFKRAGIKLGAPVAQDMYY